MFKGKFKTAYLQREIPEDAVVIGNLTVGELVKITPSVGDTPAIVEKLSVVPAGSSATDAELAAALEEATNLMAQSDMTLEYGHVPVENRDYRYSNVIKSCVDMTKVSPSGATYHGVFANTTELGKLNTTSLASNGDTALVLGTNDGGDAILTKYVATAASTTITWAAATSSAAYSVVLGNVSKKIASFKVYNKSDVIVYEG